MIYKLNYDYLNKEIFSLMAMLMVWHIYLRRKTRTVAYNVYSVCM